MNTFILILSITFIGSPQDEVQVAGLQTTTYSQCANEGARILGVIDQRALHSIEFDCMEVDTTMPTDF